MRPASRAARLGALLTCLLPLAAGCKRTSARANASPAPPSADTVVAEVDGERITMADVDRRLLEKTAQDRLFEMRRQVLDELLAERLTAREARARGLSADALTKAEVEAKARPVREEDVKELFDRSGLAARGGTLEQFRPQLERSLREQRQTERRAVFADELRAKAHVKVALEEPRTQMTLPPEAPSLGPAGAPVTLVEFLDYQCPYCHRVQGVVDEVLARYPGKVRFVHRDFPLDTIHPQAMNQARAARCAGDQGKFWEYHRRLLTEPSQDNADLRRKAAALGLDASAFSTCIASKRHDAAIESAAAQGRQVGVSGTPTFFINGRRLVGVRSPEEFSRLIEQELKQAG